MAAGCVAAGCVAAGCVAASTVAPFRGVVSVFGEALAGISETPWNCWGAAGCVAAGCVAAGCVAAGCVAASTVAPFRGVVSAFGEALAGISGAPWVCRGAAGCAADCWSLHTSKSFFGAACLVGLIMPSMTSYAFWLDLSAFKSMLSRRYAMAMLSMASRFLTGSVSVRYFSNRSPYAPDW